MGFLTRTCNQRGVQAYCEARDQLWKFEAQVTTFACRAKPGVGRKDPIYVHMYIFKYMHVTECIQTHILYMNLHMCVYACTHSYMYVHVFPYVSEPMYTVPVVFEFWSHGVQ